MEKDSFKEKVSKSADHVINEVKDGLDSPKVRSLSEKVIPHQKKTDNEKVQEFYRSFNQHEFMGTKPSLEDMTEDRIHLKMKLILEEFVELVEAVYNKESADIIQEAWDRIHSEETYQPMIKDTIEMADATADLKYVIEGFNIEAGIPADEIFDEVHRSNMSKLDENGEPIISDGSVYPLGKILKSEGYFAPDILGIINEHKRNA